MLETESFDRRPPFREHALLSDPAIYDEAERDPLGWWEQPGARAGVVRAVAPAC